MSEARLEGSDSGLAPAEEGWFVVNVRDAEWLTSEDGEKHIFIGAGEGPCAILMVGARGEGWEVLYPVSAFAARYDASVEQETCSPKEACVPSFEPSRRERPSYWARLPWA
jgi:hypothetical protein